eukprot:Clim_evm32s230 gene=Clim_evmTU32s230
MMLVPVQVVSGPVYPAQQQIVAMGQVLPNGAQPIHQEMPEMPEQIPIASVRPADPPQSLPSVPAGYLVKPAVMPIAMDPSRYRGRQYYSNVDDIPHFRDRLHACLFRLRLRQAKETRSTLYGWGRMTMTISDDKKNVIELWKPKRIEIIAIMAYIYTHQKLLFADQLCEFAFLTPEKDGTGFVKHDIDSKLDFMSLQHYLDSNWGLHKKTLFPAIVPRDSQERSDANHDAPAHPNQQEENNDSAGTSTMTPFNPNHPVSPGPKSAPSASPGGPANTIRREDANSLSSEPPNRADEHDSSSSHTKEINIEDCNCSRSQSSDSDGNVVGHQPEQSAT